MHLKKRLGALFIDIWEEALCDIYSTGTSYSFSEIYLVDEQGAVISHRDKSLLLSSVGAQGYLERLRQRSRGVFQWQLDGKQEPVAYRTIPEVGWTLVCTPPSKP